MSETKTPSHHYALTHQTQPTPTTCVHTCIAMVMGVPVAEVISRLGPEGLSSLRTVTALEGFGVSYAPLAYPSLWEGWHLVSVPSLNHTGGTHAVLLHWDRSSGELIVYDPAMGKRYREDGTDMMSWTEAILVKPSGCLRHFDRLYWPSRARIGQ